MLVNGHICTLPLQKLLHADGSGKYGACNLFGSIWFTAHADTLGLQPVMAASAQYSQPATVSQLASTMVHQAPVSTTESVVHPTVLEQKCLLKNGLLTVHALLGYVSARLVSTVPFAKVFKHLRVHWTIPRFVVSCCLDAMYTQHQFVEEGSFLRSCMCTFDVRAVCVRARV